MTGHQNEFQFLHFFNARNDFAIKNSLTFRLQDGLVEVEQRFRSQRDLLNGRCRWSYWSGRRSRRNWSRYWCGRRCWSGRCYRSDRRWRRCCFLDEIWIALCDSHCWGPEASTPAQIARCIVRAVATATYDIVIGCTGGGKQVGAVARRGLREHYARGKRHYCNRDSASD